LRNNDKKLHVNNALRELSLSYLLRTLKVNNNADTRLLQMACTSGTSNSYGAMNCHESCTLSAFC